MLSRKPARPSRNIDPVKRKISQDSATCWIQPPITETLWPATYRRKRGLVSAGGSQSCQSGKGFLLPSGRGLLRAAGGAQEARAEGGAGQGMETAALREGGGATCVAAARVARDGRNG